MHLKSTQVHTHLTHKSAHKGSILNESSAESSTSTTSEKKLQSFIKLGRCKLKVGKILF